MPNMVQVLEDRAMSTFRSHPVFDMLIKEGLYTASMTFRCKGVFPWPPGILVCCKGSTKTPFIVEEITYESEGISEVRGVSVWEALKRKNKGGWYYEHRDTPVWPTQIDPITVLNGSLESINNNKYRWFPFWIKLNANGQHPDYQIDFDLTASIYDDVYAAALYNQLFFKSFILPTKDIPSNITVWLEIGSLNNTSATPIDIGALDSVHSRVVRRLPQQPTHWYIQKTKDYGSWQMASRGRIRTWYENRAYMQETTDWSGPYRYESGIVGDQSREWGQTTEEIRCEPLKSVEVTIDEISSEMFSRIEIGNPVKCSIMGILISGYVIERTISGGDKTNYSIKIQPDRFYENGQEVTDKWI